MDLRNLLVRTKQKPRARKKRSGLSARHLFFIVAALGIICVCIFLVTYVRFNAQPEQVTARLVHNMVSRCKGGVDHTACYESEVPKLFPTYTIPQIFDVIRGIRQTDHSYQFCHVLAHKLGEKLVMQDRTKWMQAIPFNPSDGLCSNGFTHGVIGGRFRANVLTDDALKAILPDFRKACEPHDSWTPTPSMQATCYHGLGHLYVYITNAQLHKALSLCDQTTKSPSGDYGQVCREGVFMQIYQPLEPDDFGMIEQMPIQPSTTTVRQFCSAYSSDPRNEGACLRESWPFARTGIVDGTGVDAFCANQPNDAETVNCYRSASSIIGRSNLGHAGAGTRACTKLQEKWQPLCITFNATAILEEDLNAGPKAIAECMSAPSDTSKQACLSNFADHVQFYFGKHPEKRAAFCHVLPEPQQSTCLR